MRNYTFLLFNLLLLLHCGDAASQAGINVSDFSEGVAFEVQGNGAEGVILTRSNIIDLNTEAPLPTGIEEGTLTFNTNTDSGIGYVWWDKAANNWKYIDPFIGKKELYGNPVSDASAGNLNQDVSVGYKIPLFGNPEFNDSNNLYEVIDPNPSAGSNFKNLKINASGRYRIAVTLGLEAQDDNGISTNDNIVEVRLQVTDSAGNISYPGAYQHSTEMADTSGNEDDDGAVSFVEILELDQNDVLSVVSYQSSDNGGDSVELNGTRPSSFFILKIN